MFCKNISKANMTPKNSSLVTLGKNFAPGSSCLPQRRAEKSVTWWETEWVESHWCECIGGSSQTPALWWKHEFPHFWLVLRLMRVALLFGLTWDWQTQKQLTWGTWEDQGYHLLPQASQITLQILPLHLFLSYFTHVLAALSW